MLWINFKTYERGIGDRGLGLARLCEEVSIEAKVSIIVCPQTADLYRLGQQVNIELWAQHVDAINPGKNTGFQLPLAVMHAGASGVFLNHSEHPLSTSDLEKTLRLCEEVGLKTMVFASSVEKVRELDSLGADFLAFEPPSLVGGDVSVSQSEPSEISEALEACTSSTLVVGAGVHARQDVEKCLELGVGGVVVSSALMQKTEDPEALLRELVSSFIG